MKIVKHVADSLETGGVIFEDLCKDLDRWADFNSFFEGQVQ
jgi:hypothetical protein